MKATYHIINSGFFFFRQRLIAESSAEGANICIVSKIISSSIAIEVSVLIFEGTRSRRCEFKCWEGIFGDNWSFGKQFVKE